jgi:cell division protein FtsB
VGRTAGPLQSTEAVAAAKTTRRIVAAAALGISNTAAVARTGARDSTASSMVANPVAAAMNKAVRGVSTKASAALSGSKRKADSDASLQTTNSIDVEEDQAQEAEDAAELKRLRVEVADLRAQNAQLAYNQIARETEIRVEVSQEMAKRSQHLLEQIQSLQRQLVERDDSASTDITRSVKKARKRQMKTIAEEVSGRDVQEVEDELERSKATYEQEIAVLKSQNKALANAVEKLQSAAVGPTAVMTTKVNTLGNAIVGAVSNSASTFQQSIDNSSAQVAAEFSKRFSKKGNDENSGAAANVPTAQEEKCSPMNKSPASRSPNRSPLSEVRNNGGNSPVLKSYQNGTISATAKRVDSPQRVRDDASASSGTYGARLRSQQIRA